MASGSRPRPLWPRPRSHTATSLIASCRIRPSTWWTRPPLPCACRSTLCRGTSTSLSAVPPQLAIERLALEREEDANSRERLRSLENELAAVQGQSNTLKARWKLEKDDIARVHELKQRIEQLKLFAQAQLQDAQLHEAGSKRPWHASPGGAGTARASVPARPAARLTHAQGRGG